MNAPLKGVSAKADRAATPDGAEPVPVSGIAGITDADNLAIWREVERTDPKHTKKVNQRGGFTAISAHYQVKRATEIFGPVGIGWGYQAGEPIFHETLVIVPVTLWHGERCNTFGPVYGGAEWKNGSRLDSDAPKKATTDALTKALSQLGFNADVFLGRFDDNKYVEAMTREFAEGASDGEPDKAHPDATRGKPFPEGPATGIHQLKQLSRPLYRDLAACGDADQLDIVKADNKALIAQIEAAWPDGWNGIDGDGNKYPGFKELLEQKFEMENAQ